MNTKKIFLPAIALLLTNSVLAFERGGGEMGGDGMEFRRGNMDENGGHGLFGGNRQSNENHGDRQTSTSRTFDTPDGNYQVNNNVTHQSLTKEQVNTTVTDQNNGHSYSAQTQYNHVGDYGSMNSTVTNNKNGHSYTVDASHNLNGTSQSTVTNNQTGKTYSGSQAVNQIENNHQNTTTYYSTPYYGTTYYGGYYEPYPVYTVGVGIPMGGTGATNVTNNYYSNTYPQNSYNNKESATVQENNVDGYYYY